MSNPSRTLPTEYGDKTWQQSTSVTTVKSPYHNRPYWKLSTEQYYCRYASLSLTLSSHKSAVVIAIGSLSYLVQFGSTRCHPSLLIIVYLSHSRYHHHKSLIYFRRLIIPVYLSISQLYWYSCPSSWTTLI